MIFDPLSSDAPLLALLSVRENPLLTTMDETQLMQLVRTLRQHAASPQTLAAADEAAGRKVSPRAPSAKKAVLDSL